MRIRPILSVCLKKTPALPLQNTEKKKTAKLMEKLMLLASILCKIVSFSPVWEHAGVFTYLCKIFRCQKTLQRLLPFLEEEAQIVLTAIFLQD